MRSIKLLLFVASLTMIFIVSCDDNDPAKFTTTPYELNIPSSLPRPALPADNPLTQEGIALGKELFFDKMLSGDNTQSCASCHNQQFAFTDSLKALSEGIRGMEGKRNSMPLFNLFYHNNGFFWDGRAPLLRDQSLLPIQDELEMDADLDEVVEKLKATEKYPQMFYDAFGSNEITSEKMSLAMEQYMFTLVSGNSKYDRVIAGLEEFTESEQKGFEMFFEEHQDGLIDTGADCFHCHGGPNFTNDEFMNNGLDENHDNDKGYYETTGNQNDIGKFKVPSLRNVAVSAPYMHDGRFETLEEVIDHYDTGVKRSPTLDPNMHIRDHGFGFSNEEKKALVDFLKTLTDNEYLNNQEYKR